MRSFVQLLCLLLLVINGGVSQAGTARPVLSCAAGGDFGNDGLVIELYPIRGNPDAFRAVHTEITPGGSHEYMRVFVFKEQTKTAIEFSGGPLRLKLLLDVAKVKSVEDELLQVAELETVNSFGSQVAFSKPTKGMENYEMFLCRNKLRPVK